MVAGIFFCFCADPDRGLVRGDAEAAGETSRSTCKGLYANSPVAVVGCFLVGVANGAWGTLGAVYGARIGISTVEIALMMSIVVVAGAVMQLPVGRISDLTDRRYVLAAAAVGSAVFALLVFLVQPRTGWLVIVMTGLYGALAYTLYSIAVAHANDHARPEDFVKVSGGLLLLYGFGTMVGPVLGARADGRDAAGKPVPGHRAAAHILLAAYALLRISRRAPVPREAKDAFKTLPADRAVTPEAARLDPRTKPAGG